MTKEEMKQTLQDHNTRITLLEKFVWTLTGAISYGALQNLPLLKDAISSTITLLPHFHVFAFGG